MAYLNKIYDEIYTWNVCFRYLLTINIYAVLLTWFVHINDKWILIRVHKMIKLMLPYIFIILLIVSHRFLTNEIFTKTLIFVI